MANRRFELLSKKEKGLLVIRQKEYIFSHYSDGPKKVEKGKVLNESSELIFLFSASAKRAFKRRWKNIWILSSSSGDVVHVFKEKIPFWKKGRK